MAECQKYECIYNRLTKDFIDKHHWPSYPRWLRELDENLKIGRRLRYTAQYIVNIFS